MPACPDCGAANPAGTLFCLGCARPVGAAAPAPAAVATATRTPKLVAIENLVPTGLALELPATDYDGTLYIGRTDLAGGTVVDLDLSAHGGHERRVSRRHAKLRYAGGVVYLADWGSAHGTWVDKQKLAPDDERALADGMEVRLADFVFRFELR